MYRKALREFLGKQHLKATRATAATTEAHDSSHSPVIARLTSLELLLKDDLTRTLAWWKLPSSWSRLTETPQFNVKILELRYSIETENSESLRYSRKSSSIRSKPALSYSIVWKNGQVRNKEDVSRSKRQPTASEANLLRVKTHTKVEGYRSDGQTDEESSDRHIGMIELESETEDGVLSQRRHRLGHLLVHDDSVMSADIESQNFQSSDRETPAAGISRRARSSLEQTFEGNETPIRATLHHRLMGDQFGSSSSTSLSSSEIGDFNERDVDYEFDDTGELVKGTSANRLPLDSDGRGRRRSSHGKLSLGHWDRVRRPGRSRRKRYRLKGMVFRDRSLRPRIVGSSTGRRFQNLPVVEQSWSEKVVPQNVHSRVRRRLLKPRIQTRRRKKRLEYNEHTSESMAVRTRSFLDESKPSRKTEAQLFVRRRGKLPLKSLRLPMQKSRLWKQLLTVIWDISPPMVSQLLDRFPTRKSLRKVARRVQLQDPNISVLCAWVAPQLTSHIFDLAFFPGMPTGIGIHATESQRRQTSGVSTSSITCCSCGRQSSTIAVREPKSRISMIPLPLLYLPAFPVASIVPVLHRYCNQDTLIRRLMLRTFEFHSVEVPKLYSLELIQALRADSGRIIELLLIDLANVYPSFHHQLFFPLFTELLVCQTLRTTKYEELYCM